MNDAAMPNTLPKVGSIVYWWEGSGFGPTAAIVTRANGALVSLVKFFEHVSTPQLSSEVPYSPVPRTHHWTWPNEF